MIKKKLLFIVNVDWFFISHRLPIASKALEEGYEVHLICAITDADKAECLENAGLIVHPLSFSRSGRNIFREFSIIFKLYQHIKNINPDLLHLVTIKPVLYGGILARALNVPAVVSAISGLGFLFVKRLDLRVRLLRYAVLFLYRKAMGHANQQVIFQNPADRDALVKAGRVDKGKTLLIRGSGVDLRRYPVKPEPSGVPVVVMASRLLKDKGAHEFVDAARLLLSQGVIARFWLIGEPDQENPESITAETVRVWQQEGIVDCLGFRSDIAELFSQAHIVVLPSYYGEGLPKVLIEAAACGRAVVTTDMPGCRDAIEPDVSGLLVPARDTGALAQAVGRLIEDISLRQQMAEAGRALAEREFGIDKVVATHLVIYRQLMEK